MNKGIELLGILFVIATFVWEMQTATSEQKIVAWMMLATILVMLCIFIVLNYLKDKVRQLDNNSICITKLERH